MRHGGKDGESRTRQNRAFYATTDPMARRASSVHVSLIAIPEAVISTLSGIYDVLNAFGMLQSIAEDIPDEPPFEVRIVGVTRDPVPLASGLPIAPHCGLADVEATDIVIVPSVVVGSEGWAPGRYPELVDWANEAHAQGALLCSACSGVFLLAETGLFDGQPTTVHWGYADTFRRSYPKIPLSPERALIASGTREELISSGASTSWHDLVLYLTGRFVGATAAHAVAKFFALQWHSDSIAPYIVFSAPMDHGDAVIREAQEWLSTHYSVAHAVEEMIRRSGLATRTFQRRFTKATGHAPIAYTQRVRIEEAKRRLERTSDPIDEIGWSVGYEEPAFFRRLFRRVTHITPGAYRRKFQMPMPQREESDDTG